MVLDQAEAIQSRQQHITDLARTGHIVQGCDLSGYPRE
jgi:hypothetical protein